MTIAVEKELWPNFFIVGAMKAGTTSLYYYLKEVNGIFLSSVKEPNFFASEDIPNNSFRRVIRDKKQYLSLFNGSMNANAIGEASTDYLYSKNAAKNIHNVIPNAKIIMILRDPIERAFSHYLSNVRYKQFNIHNMTFYEALHKDYGRKDRGIGRSLLYIESGLYYEKVKNYLELFGNENVLIMFFEEFVINTTDHMRKVLKFLNVKSEVPHNINNIYNSYFTPKNKMGHLVISNKKINSLSKLAPKFLKDRLKNQLFSNSDIKPHIPSDAREYLVQIYQEDVSKLETLLKSNLPWSNLR